MVGAMSRARQGSRTTAADAKRNRQSSPNVELPLADAAGLKLIGIAMLSEINGDMNNRIAAFACVKPQDFAEPALGEIWTALKMLHGRGEPLTPDRVASAVRPRVRDVAAILAEALCGVDRAITTRDAVFYAQQVTAAADERRLRLILHDAQRSLTASPCTSDATNQLQEALSALAADRNARQAFPTSMFDRFAQSILDRERPKFFEVASYRSKLREITIGPSIVTLFGAPPGAGKTACVLQLIFDAHRQPGQEHLKSLVANVEMSPEALLTRQLARLSGVGHAWLLHRDFDEAAVPKLQDALDELRALMPRIEFMSPPFTLERLAERAKAHEADIVVVAGLVLTWRKFGKRLSHLKLTPEGERLAVELLERHGDAEAAPADPSKP